MTYTLLHRSAFFWADRTGLEPATPCVTGTYSNQLNYRSEATFLQKRCKDMQPILTMQVYLKKIKK